MGTLVLDDRSGRIECTLFNEAYEQHRELINADNILVVSGSLNYDEFRGGLSIRADNLLTFEQARSHYA
jgi:DNA polymerase-3 subunit alpha